MLCVLTLVFNHFWTVLVFVLHLNTILGFQNRPSTQLRAQTFKIRLDNKSRFGTPLHRNLVNRHILFGFSPIVFLGFATWQYFRARKLLLNTNYYAMSSSRISVIAGDNFGRGAARDWATKGPYLLGVRVVLATSFNPTFRANLVKIGILPLKIDRDFYFQVKGRESFTVNLPDRDLLLPKVIHKWRHTTSGMKLGFYGADVKLRCLYITSFSMK